MTATTTHYRSTLALALTGATIALSACGDDEEPASEPTTSPAQAITEIGAVRSGLDEALAAYEQGDADTAEQLAGDAYLEHFELVEGPLEEADAELNEELEELIREELRGAIVDGQPVKAVGALVEEANTGLDEAELLLEEPPA